MKNKIKIIIIIISVIALNISCDQSTKEFARNNLKNKGTIRVIDNFLILKYTENDGAFLSIASGLPQPFKQILLTIFPAFILAGLLVYTLTSEKLSILQVICFSSIIGGGISNIFDRIIYNGFVTDFINFGIGNLRTGILNFADMSITFGAIGLIIEHYRQTRKVKE